MRKLKEVLRLHSLGLSQHQIARSCSISQSTVHEYVRAAQAAGAEWPLPEDWDDGRIENALFPQRPAPEKLLRALLLQVLYTIRSERMLMEQLEYNLLFRWFVGMNMDEPVWMPTVFSKNRERLLDGDVANRFFAEVLEQARAADLTSDEHFSVDGTLIEAWASQKSFQCKDRPSAKSSDDDPGNPSVNFRGEERRNDTHESTTDPDARLARKSRSWPTAGAC